MGFSALETEFIRTIAWKEDTLLIQSLSTVYVCHVPVSVAHDEEGEVSMHWKKSLAIRPWRSAPHPFGASFPEGFTMLDAYGKSILWFWWANDTYRLKIFDLQKNCISSSQIVWKYDEAQSPSCHSFPKVMSDPIVLVANHWRKNPERGLWSTTLLKYDLSKTSFVTSEFSDIDLRIPDYNERLGGISQALCKGEKIFFWTYTPERTFNVFDTQHGCHQRMKPRQLRFQVSLFMICDYKQTMHMERNGPFMHTDWGDHITVYEL